EYYCWLHYSGSHWVF
nr:immunoglobulin light chain junction region [Macaca mulatta]